MADARLSQLAVEVLVSPSSTLPAQLSQLAVEVLILEANLVIVPDVVGMTEAAADTALVAATLVTGTVTVAFHPIVPAGQVVSQSPVAGSTVEVGSAVNLVVSSGALPDYTWQINDLTGATRWMTGLLLFPVGETPTPGVVTPGHVIIPMHVVTRVFFPASADGVPDDCCCH